MKEIVFGAMIHYIGSPVMAPQVVWAQICHENPEVTTARPTSGPQTSSSTVPTLPADDTCVEIIDYTYDLIDKWDVAEQVLLSVALETDINRLVSKIISRFRFYEIFGKKIKCFKKTFYIFLKY